MQRWFTPKLEIIYNAYYVLYKVCLHMYYAYRVRNNFTYVYTVREIHGLHSKDHVVRMPTAFLCGVTIITVLCNGLYRDDILRKTCKRSILNAGTPYCNSYNILKTMLLGCAQSFLMRGYYIFTLLRFVCV